jgi:hypothetical protein
LLVLRQLRARANVFGIFGRKSKSDGFQSHFASKNPETSFPQFHPNILVFEVDLSLGPWAMIKCQFRFAKIT